MLRGPCAITVLDRYGRVCIIHLSITGEKSFSHRDEPRKISLCTRLAMGFLSSFGKGHEIYNIIQTSNFPSGPPEQILYDSSLRLSVCRSVGMATTSQTPVFP